MAKGHIFIGIPTADKTITTGTTKSLYRLTLALQKADIATSLMFADSADIIENRNTLSAFFLESKASHLLFIDSDIEFEPQLVGDFVNLKQPIVGAAYPKRQIDTRILVEAYEQLKEIKDPDERFRAAKARASHFPFVVKKGMRVQNGFVSANGIPAGLMLIHRRVFDTMVDQRDKIDLQQLGPTPLWPKGGHHGFFDRVWIEDKKYWLSEDLSFCNRWVQGVGEEIYAYIGPGVVHHGNMAYDANYFDFAKNQAIFAKLKASESRVRTTDSRVEMKSAKKAEATAPAKKTKAKKPAKTR